MSMELIRKAAQRNIKAERPQFDIGDTVDVSVKIIEGEKERVQVFNGTVIARRGCGTGETFIVRRIVNNEGVERIFPVQSPRIESVKVVRSGRIRRAKLYYLRDRVGKATTLRERRRVSSKAAAQRPAKGR